MTIRIHGESFDVSKSDNGIVSLRQTFGFARRWFDTEAQFRLWAKPYLRF